MVICPKCRGLCHLVEHHVLDGQVVRIEHHCILCASGGFVSAEVAREWWRNRPPHSVPHFS